MKKVLTRSLRSVLVLFFFGIFQTLYAADFYWINGAGNWSDPSHWSYSSGGSSAGVLPGSGDHVKFDANSFTENYQQVILPSNVAVSSFTVSSSRHPVFMGSSVILTLSNSLNLVKPAHFDLGGKIVFASLDGAWHSINSTGISCNTDIEFASGKWQLNGHLIISYSNTISFLAGEFKSNGHSVAAKEIIANTVGMSINFGTSHILGTEKIIIPAAANTGGAGAFFVNNLSYAPVWDLGAFTGSGTKDVHVDCPNPPFMLDLLITSDYNGQDISCADSCDGELTIVASGTPGPWAYSFEAGPFTSQTVYPDLCNLTFDFVVRDSSIELIPGSGIYALCAISEGLVEPGSLSVGAPITFPASCPDSCDAFAFTFPSGGTPTYTLFWPVSGETTPNPVGLCAGWNTVEMTDVNGCFKEDSVFVAAVPQIVPDFVVTPPSCNGDCDAEVDVIPSGGNGGPYTVSWVPNPASGAGTDPGIGFCSGVVSLTVFDQDGCPKDTTVTIIDPPVLTLAIGPIDSALCFDSCDGEATATGGGGVPGYTYEWFEDVTDILVGTGSTFSGFCAGDYYCVVTDASGCEETSAVFTIEEPTPLDATQAAYSVSCTDFADGSVDVDASGGSPPYTYSWTTFPGMVGIGAADSLSGLPPGFYQVTVTDANGCDTTLPAIEVLNPPPLSATFTFTDPTCYDLCDGSVIVTPGGGTPGYFYLWSPVPPVGGASATPSGMCDGTYDLTITDSEGCPLDTTVTLTNPALFDVTAVITDLLCSGDSDGAIDVTVNSGGSGSGYIYTWFPVPPVGAGTLNISGLTAGTWSLTITDDMGCDTTIDYTISSPSALVANAVLIANVSCFGDCTGAVNVIIAGGTLPYSILWSDPGATTTAVASSLCAGMYTVTVTDDNGCVDTDNQLVTQPAPYDLDTSHTDNTCSGDCIGTATVTVNSGGTIPYSILWDDPAAQTTFTAVALCDGVYTATVTDGNGCDTVITFTITSPPVIVIDTNLIDNACDGTCDGEAYITVAGGIPAYTFEWFDASTGIPLLNNNDSISGLCPGDYYATVTDQNGCTIGSDTLTIIELPSITTSLVSFVDATCGNCDGSAEVSAAGGAGGFTFDWTPNPLVGDGTAIVSGLCAGVYSVNITDAAGCSALMAVNINSVAVEVLVLDSLDASCFGVCDGEINASWVSVDPPYTIQFFFEPTGLSAAGPFAGAISPFNQTGLCADNYIVTLTNTLGCQTSDTITINEPPQITGVITPTMVTCNGNCDGTATIVSAGGEGAHSYNWVPMPGGGQGTNAAVGLCDGIWTVEVTDDSGCMQPFSIAITEPPVLVITLETSNDISCFGANDGTATVAAAGGTAPLNFDWIDCATGLPIGQTTSTATGLGPGDYQCVITDDNGCTVTSVCLPVVEPTPITAVINTQGVTCFGECDGILDAVPSGGVLPYFFQWQDEFGVDLAGQTNDTMSNVCQGIYNLEITDGNGCSMTFGPFDMTAPASAWNITESQIDPSCVGDCNGTATVTVLAGNNPPYTYLWDDPFAQTTPTATTLCAGTYNVTIFDAGVCDTTITFTINDPAPIIANAVITNVACNGDCTGQITVAPSGGTPPYTINWSDLQVGATASGLCAGAITCSITDGSGCVLDTTIIITEPSAITSISSFSNPSTCGVCNGSASVNVVGGTPGYTYDWTPDPTAGEGTPFATGYCPGVVTCTITDAAGCTLVESFAISDINGEDLDSALTDASCFGVCDGTADVIYVCSDPVCSNQWYDGLGALIPGETGTSITGLCAGDYFCEVTNGSGCISIMTLTISEPTQIIANEVITPVVCNGDANGAIDIFPSGGSGGGYTFVWDPVPPVGAGTASVSGLSAGTWCVEMTDSDGCIDTACIDLLDPTPITVTPTAQDASCNGTCDGILTVVVAGGGGGYSLQWLDGALAPIAGETSPIIGGLCAGNYFLEVTDANGCVQVFGPYTVAEPIPISGPVVGVNVTCNGDCDGSVTVTPAGGVPPYIIVWYDSSGLTGDSGPTASSLCPEDYYAVIQDQNGCNFTTATVSITEPAPLTAVVSSTDASCFGVCDGTADVVPAGGTPAYIYEWLDISGTPIVGGTTPSVINLCAGNYTIEVTDQNGCSTGLLPVVINEFPDITGMVFTNDATCGVADGSATVFAGGGNPPYTYQWFDVTMTALAGETSNILLNQFAGTYWVEVTDANGCTDLFIALISNFDNTDVTFDAINNPSCFGSSDGSIDITVTGTNPPFTYIWNPGGLVAEDPTGLTAGTYDLQITDAVGCINFYSTTLVDPPQIVITTVSITPSDCGVCNGAIDISVAGGTPALSIDWNNGSTGVSVSGLCAGVYEVVVTDANGCIEDEEITVPNSGGMLGDAVITAITCAGGCDGQIVVSGVGGTAPYTYLWLHDGSTSDTQTGLCAGDYFCEITDATGCTFTMPVTLVDPPAITITTNMISPNCGMSDGIITVVSASGILPHTYLWSTGDATATVTGLPAGIYTVTVTDAAGCVGNFVLTLSNVAAPTAELTGTDVLCYGDCNGTLDTLSQTGGTPGYTYQWYDGLGVAIAGATNPALGGVCPGNYILQITDVFGCTSFQSYTIGEPDTIITNPLFMIDPTCFGDCDGLIVSNPFGGTLPFSFVWDDPAAQTTSTASGLCDGTYTVIITDANGCTTSQTGTLVEPTQIIITVDSTVAATCLNSADGEIWVTVSGGSPPYTYEYVSATLTDTFTVEDPLGILPMDYYLTVTDATGCTATDTISVDTLLVVFSIAGPDSLVCFGDTLIYIGTSNVAGATFIWSDTLGNILSDSSQLTIPGNVPNAVDTYILTVSFGPCSHTDTIVITTGDSLFVDAGPDIELYPTQSGAIGGSPTNTFTGATVLWTPPTYLDDPVLENPTVDLPQVSTWYTVTLTDTNGCRAVDSMYVEVLPDIIIPDGISPNGDGLNDTWILDFLDQYPGTRIEITVYNRWGETLFTADQTYNDDWGGTSKKGHRLPAGTYYYTIFIDHPDFPNPFTGPITIMW